MKRVTSLIFMMLMLSFFWTTTAQVSTYTFASSSGTFTPITGGTLLGTETSDDQRFVDPAVPAGGTTTTGVGLPIGFNFVYDGNTFDRFAVNNNGWISLGQSSLTPSVNNASTSGYTPISSTTVITPDLLVSRIAGMARDLQAQVGATLRFETLGTTPNSILVIQWLNYKKYGSTGTGDSYSFQIRLYETTNVVEFVYGTVVNNATAGQFQVGLRGAPSATATNFFNRTTTTDWSATTPGGIATASCTIDATVFPASGLTFTFTPAPATAPGLPYTPSPANLASNVSITPTLTWTFGLNTLTYDLYFGTDNPPLTKVVDNAAAGATGTYIPGTLSYNTPYFWYVVAKNNADLETVGPLWSFTTTCETVNAPFVEAFTTWPPSCWSLSGGTYSWVQYVLDPLYCAKANYWGQTSGNTDVMTTPPINIAGLAAPNLKFDWSHLYSSSYPLDALTVLVSDDGGLNFTEVWYKAGTDLNSNDGAGNTAPGTFVSSGNIDLSGFGDVVLVKFYGYSGYGPDLFVDNVTVYEPSFGTLAGNVTSATSKGPIEGALITAGDYSTTTDQFGDYTIPNMAVGTYDVTCEAEGYFAQTVTGVVIAVNQTTTQDFVLGFAQIQVDPASVTITLLPDATGTETLTISNPGGTEPLAWTASIQMVAPETSKLKVLTQTQPKTNNQADEMNPNPSNYKPEATDAMFDLLGSFPVHDVGGTYSVATDGNFLYTGRWNLNQYDKYALDGTWIESFSIPGAGLTRDLAFDGQYFYGSPNSAVIYQMDFNTKTLVSSITATGNQVRGIAYDPDTDGFWVTAASFTGPFRRIDRTGATVQTVTPAFGGISGLAYDNVTPGGPYLWAYTPAASTNTHIIIQVDMTGATVQQFDLATFGITAAGTVSGGLEISDGAVPGKWSIMGVSQNDIVWLLELAESSSWLSLDENNGVIEPGQSQVVNVTFDATGLVDSTYLANINITHNGQQVTDGTVTVPVSLIVASTTPPIAPTLVSPAAGATLVPLQPVFEWLTGPGTSQVQIEIKRGSGPFSVTIHKSLWMPNTIESYSLAEQGVTLLKKQVYTWLVRAKNAAGTIASGTRTFTTIGAGTVGGVVADAFNNLPLSGATVTIPATGQTATTAADGSYTIPNVLEGTYDVTAELEGYLGQTKSATVVHNQLALTNFALNIVLDPPVGLTAELEDFVNVNLQWHEPGYTGGGNVVLINELFETYNAGQQLVQQAIAQGKDYWTTWSNLPGSAEDPFISNVAERNNSVLIEGANDLVLLLGDKTTGNYNLEFNMYVTTGFLGYFNVLHAFAGAASEWGLQVYFNMGGAGLVDAAGAGAATFTFGYDTWIPMKVNVNLDQDLCKFYVDGNLVVEYQWSLGTFGTAGLNQLAAANFYAYASAPNLPKFYIDNVVFTELGDGFEPTWLQWCQETSTNSIGTNAAANFDVAARFTPDMLTGFPGGSITKVQFIPAEAACTYTIEIWQGVQPPTLIYSQVVPVVTLSEWNEVILNTPVPIDLGQELWIGYNVNTTTGYPAGCDPGPQHEGFGNMINWGGWTTLTALNATLTFDWSIKGYVEAAKGSGILEPVKPIASNGHNTGTLSANPLPMPVSMTKSSSSSRDVEGYNVYRNGDLLGTTTELFYNDLDLTSGVYTYTLTAIYPQGESDPIGPATVDVLPAPVLISAEPDYYGVDLMWVSSVTDKIAKGSYSTSDVEKIKYKEPSTRVYDPNKYPRNPKQGGETIADALVIGTLPFYEQGTTEGYLNDYDEACPYTGSTAPEVVYSFTPAEDLLLTISLCESLFDTKLYVYENEYTQGNPYACNDDYATCPDWQSQLDDLYVQAGNTYYIVVDAYGTDFGTYIIDITGQPYVPCVVECPVGAIAEGEVCPTDGYVDNFNGGCNSIPVVYSPITCGDIICGTTGTYILDGANRRDTDWYELVLTSPKTLTWSVTAELPVYAFIIDGNLGCAGLTIIAQGAGAACETAVATATVAPGTYWLWVGPQLFTGYPCADANDYIAELTCEDAFLTYFDVFRDGNDIADVYGYTYRDEAIENGGTYCYSVLEHVSPDYVTPQSNVLCATVPLIPVIGVNPAELSETHLEPPMVTTQTVTINNTGLGILDWNLSVVMNEAAKGSKAYCDASTTTQDEYIANVLCGSINNTSGWQGGVADYTAISTTIEAGAAEPITVTNGNAWAADIVYCWVDWDMSETWDQATNEEYMLTNVGGTGLTFTGAIAVPEDVPTGSYRMRVRMTYSTAPVPCGVATYGEVEDYTINVLGGAQWLTADVLSGSLGAGESTDITVTFNSEELDYGMYAGSLNFTSNDPVTPEVMVPVAFEVVYNLSNISGTVTDALAKGPVEGVTILVDELRGYTTMTLADGTYSIDVPVGVYNITASKAGYISQTVTGVMTILGQTIVQNFQLEFAAPVMISADADFFGVELTWEGNPAVSGYPYKGATMNYSLSNVAEATPVKEEHYGVYDPTMYPSPKQGGETIATALAIAALPFADQGTTTGYVNDYDEACPYTGGTAPDVVYSFTANENMLVDIDLCGSSYDTKIYVYENEPTPGNPFACNDDYYLTAVPCGAYVSALFDLILYGGNTYYIVIDGYGTNNGDYMLNMTGEAVFLPYYKIFRDDDQIAETYFMSYYDEDIVNGETYCYTVDQVIQPGLITGISNELCATVPIQPVISVNPLELTESLEVGGTSTQNLEVMNGSAGDLNFTVNVSLTAKNVILSDSKPNMADAEIDSNPVLPSSPGHYTPTDEDPVLNFSFGYPIDGVTYPGQAGIESDGTYIYTTDWQTADAGKFYAYLASTGAYLGQITVAGLTTIGGGIRDMAYDGAFFYGSPSTTTCYQFTLDGATLTGTLIGQWTAPTAIRAIAYNDDNDSFYANNWSTAITEFSRTGTSLGSFAVVGSYSSFYGFAYDNLSPDGFNLWGFAQTAPTVGETSTIVQMTLPSGAQTGYAYNTMPDVGSAAGIAGGLCLVPGVTDGNYTIMGLIQNEYIVGYSVIVEEPWLTVSPEFGTINGVGSMNLDVNFNAADLAEGIYTAEIAVMSNDPMTPSILVPVTLYVGMPTQEVTLPMGWSAWSSYMNPDAKMTMEDLMAPVVDNMVITQYFNQLYYPMYNINTLGEFSNEHGYITKMTEEDALTMMGTMADPTVSLTAGWNLFPVLQECSIAAADVFSNMAGFIIAYEVGGNGIWYPAGAVYTLADLVPGKAYWVKVSGAVDYTFPGCLTKGGVANVLPLRPENKTNWNDVSFTGLSHAVIFSEKATSEMFTGDVIGAFTSSGICAGMVEVSNAGNGFVMFGDDITTTAADGFTVGETMSYKLFRQATGEEFTMDVVYSTQVPNYDGNFAINGLSVISDLTLKSTGIGNVDLGNLSIYPNPSTGIFNVVINDLDKDINYTIVNAQGQEVYTGKLLETQQIDLSTQPKGVYFIKFSNETVLRIEKLVIK